jgi:LysM repeat protein
MRATWWWSPAVVSALAVGGAVVGGCADDEAGAGETLPPIRTTTTMATTTTSTLPEGRIFYEIKPGETLSIIAERFQVPVKSIVDLNRIENPDDVPAGATIEIPTGVILIDELPAAPSSDVSSSTP